MITVETAEQELRTAMLNSDVERLDELLADNLLFTNHLGMMISKEDDLSAHKSGFAKINALELSDMSIRTAGDVSVVSVLAEISGEFGGEPASGSFRFMRVWEKNSGHWRVIAAQSTLV